MGRAWRPSPCRQSGWPQVSSGECERQIRVRGLGGGEGFGLVNTASKLPPSNTCPLLTPPRIAHAAGLLFLSRTAWMRCQAQSLAWGMSRCTRPQPSLRQATCGFRCRITCCTADSRSSCPCSPMVGGVLLVPVLALPCPEAPLATASTLAPHAPLPAPIHPYSRGLPLPASCLTRAPCRPRSRSGREEPPPQHPSRRRPSHRSH